MICRCRLVGAIIVWYNVTDYIIRVVCMCRSVWNVLRTLIRSWMYAHHKNIHIHILIHLHVHTYTHTHSWNTISCQDECQRKRKTQHEERCVCMYVCITYICKHLLMLKYVLGKPANSKAKASPVKPKLKPGMRECISVWVSECMCDMYVLICIYHTVVL